MFTPEQWTFEQSECWVTKSISGRGPLPQLGRGALSLQSLPRSLPRSIVTTIATIIATIMAKIIATTTAKTWKKSIVFAIITTIIAKTIVLTIATIIATTIATTWRKCIVFAISEHTWYSFKVEFWAQQQRSILPPDHWIITRFWNKKKSTKISILRWTGGFERHINVKKFSSVSSLSRTESCQPFLCNCKILSADQLTIIASTTVSHPMVTYSSACPNFATNDFSFFNFFGL